MTQTVVPEIKGVVGRIRALRPDGRELQGTAFLVQAGYALTAFHNVGDRALWIASQKLDLYMNVRFEWSGHLGNELPASVVDGCFDPGEDWALLRIKDGAPIRIPPLSEITSTTSVWPVRPVETCS